MGHEKILVALTRNDYEPDICYFKTATAPTFASEQSKFPAPDFIAELLSDSTEHIDRGIKFNDYAGHGFNEYWIIDPEKEAIEQYGLPGERYDLLVKARQGPVENISIAGFIIPVRAVFEPGEHVAALQSVLGA